MYQRYVKRAMDWIIGMLTLALLWPVLLLAALAAEGETIVEGSAFVERGYEKLEDALTFLGGRVQLVS